MQLLQDNNISIAENSDDFALYSKRDPDLFEELEILQKAKLLNQTNFDALIQKTEHASTLGKGLQILHGAKLLNQPNFDALIQNTPHVLSLAAGLKKLHQTGILDETNRIALIQHAEHATSLANGLYRLHQANILDEANRIVLIQNPPHALLLAGGLVTLHQANILDEENRNLLIQNAQHAASLAKGLLALWQAKLLDETNRNNLIQNIQHGYYLELGLTTLRQTNLLNQNNFDALILNMRHVPSFVESLEILMQVNLLNKDSQDNFDALIQNVEHALPLAQGLKNLQQANLLDKTNFIALIQNAEHASSLGEGLKRLQQANILETNRTTLIKNSLHIDSLANALVTLQKVKILNQENFNILIQNKQNASSFANVLSQLQKIKILNQDTFDVLIQNVAHIHPEYVSVLAWGISVLNRDGNIKHLKSEGKDFKNIFKIIYTENTGKFSSHEKIAAFFIDNQELIKRDPSSPKIHKMLSEIKPDAIGKKIGEILNKMGGYTFLPENKSNVTLGVEIEYSNIPECYEVITESTMHLIQKGWSHPGDHSVEVIGEDSYKGETTTPIISNDTQLKHAMVNIAFLEAMGGETNVSCGLHVHIGVENLVISKEFEKINQPIIDSKVSRQYTPYQLEFIKQFLMIYKREESQFTSIERNYNTFMRAVQIDSIKNIKTLGELINKINPLDRDYEFNLHAYDKHGTIEVRRFSGTTEESQIYATTALIASMAEEAKLRTNEIFQKRISEAKTEYEHSPSVEKNYETFFKKQKTSLQTELLMLRGVKQSHVSRLAITSPSLIYRLKKKRNTAYIYLNEHDQIAYVSHDNNKPPQTGTLDDVDRFKNIIIKLKKEHELDLEEKNQILYAIADKGHATISHRVDKQRLQLRPKLKFKLNK